MSAVEEWASRYITKYGLALVPIPPGSKGPVYQGWNQPGRYVTDVCDVPDRWDGIHDHGIGAVLGPSGLCSIDVDAPDHALPVLGELGIDLDSLCKATPTIQGNPSRYRLMFKAPSGAQLSRKALAWPARQPGEKPLTLFELRAGDIQDVLPPTIHPGTGKPYIWLTPPNSEFPCLPEILLELWQHWGSYVKELEAMCPWAKHGFKPEPAPRGTGARPDVIATFNRARPAEELLTAHGYKQRGKRWISPTSSSGLAGIAILDGRVYSHHASDPLSDGHAHDAFDLLRILDHGGDAKSAVKAAAEDLGMASAAGPKATAGDEPRPDKEWPEPQPIDRETAQPEPYPLDALPAAIGKAVREYQAYGQQPAALVASSALAVVSLAAQGLADVARDERLRGPLSLNFLIIAKSGERKTAADRALGATLADWERERADALREDIKLNRAALEAWVAEQEGIKAAIKGAVRKKPEEADKLKERLVKHALDKPAEIIAPRLRYEDVNPQSLAFMLAAGHPSAALWSDEGGMVTGSHGMGKDSLLGFMAGLNRLWDGGAIHHDRKQAQSVHLEGRRLTVSLMVQPLVLRELAQRGGGLIRGSGFLARYLVAAPLSTMGARPYQEAPPGMPHLAAFHRRVRELLDSPLPLDDQRRLSLPVFRLSTEAFVVWRDYHDAIERELRPLGAYATVCDFAAKSAENAARIAGCIHVFEGAQGAIPDKTMQRATTLARWYLCEALRVLDVLDEPQAWSDARLLDAWLAKAGDGPIRDVLRLGPSPLRDKARRNAAIGVLEELGRARIERDGKRETLARNPALRQFATATPATFATDERDGRESVAEVATVAVAERPNPEIERGEL